MNNLIVYGSENKLDFLKLGIMKINLRKIFSNSITFTEHDNLESQLKIFFGGDLIDLKILLSRFINN